MNGKPTAVDLIIAGVLRRGRYHLASDVGIAAAVVAELSDAGYVIAPKLPVVALEADYDENAERLYAK